MEVNYKIRAAFKKDIENRHSGQSAGHFFWQLIQETLDPTLLSRSMIVQETLYAFPISKEVEKIASTHSNTIKIHSRISGFPKKWRVYCFDHTLAHAYHFLPEADETDTVYGDPLEEAHAEMLWQRAKSHKINLSIDHPNSITLSNTLRNTIYALLAQSMQLAPHLFPALTPTHPSTPLLASTQHTSRSSLSLHQSLQAGSGYKIKAAMVHIMLDVGSFKIQPGPQTGHYFWILAKDTPSKEEVMVDSIHGYSTRYSVDAYGNIHPRIPRLVGTWNSRLKVYSIDPASHESNIPCDALPLCWREPSLTHTVYAGQDAFERWQQVKCLLKTLNDLEMNYSFFGFGKSLSLLNCKNSNSAYTTIAYLLGLAPHRFKGYLAPGIKTTMLSKKALQGLTNKAQPTEETYHEATGTRCTR